MLVSLLKILVSTYRNGIRMVMGNDGKYYGYVEKERST